MIYAFHLPIGKWEEENRINLESCPKGTKRNNISSIDELYNNNKNADSNSGHIISRNIIISPAQKHICMYVNIYGSIFT